VSQDSPTSIVSALCFLDWKSNLKVARLLHCQVMGKQRTSWFHVLLGQSERNTLA
jgi:hypothetical protein